MTDSTLNGYLGINTNTSYLMHAMRFTNNLHYVLSTPEEWSDKYIRNFRVQEPKGHNYDSKNVNEADFKLCFILMGTCGWF